MKTAIMEISFKMEESNRDMKDTLKYIL